MYSNALMMVWKMNTSNIKQMLVLGGKNRRSVAILFNEPGSVRGWKHPELACRCVGRLGLCGPSASSIHARRSDRQIDEVTVVRLFHRFATEPQRFLQIPLCSGGSSVLSLLVDPHACVGHLGLFMTREEQLKGFLGEEKEHTNDVKLQQDMGIKI